MFFAFVPGFVAYIAVKVGLRKRYCLLFILAVPQKSVPILLLPLLRPILMRKMRKSHLPNLSVDKDRAALFM